MHESEVAQLCPTLSDPMDGECSPPGSSIHGIVQARVLEQDAIAFSESLALRNIAYFLLFLLSFFQPHEKILCAQSVHASHWYSPILSSLNGPEKITNMQADKGPNCTLEPIPANLSLYQPALWLIY